MGSQLDRIARGIVDGSRIEILYRGRLGGMEDSTREPGLEYKNDPKYRMKSLNTVDSFPTPCGTNLDSGHFWHTGATGDPYHRN